MTDTYYTIAAAATGMYKDRGSKFLAYAFPISSEEDSRSHLGALRKMHPKAHHHCFAWRLGLDGNNFRANDDGEPAGTAGRPILGQIDSFDLTNVLVIVVRYFGGTLLGTSGLIQAYKLSAATALKEAEHIEKIVMDVFDIRFGYERMNQVMGAVKQLDLSIEQQDFSATGCKLQITIRHGERAAVLRQFKAIVAAQHIETIQDDTAIEGLTIDYLFTQ
ncbi:MAG TPA: YigZ family protein [Saprospiraceae bacterium]|nr:YigZ family protein [Saprospiraceae bacterium]HMP15313.1 YigZ family protein [Saprospiraceae bacterium]